MKTAKTIESVSVSADYLLEGEYWLEVPFQGGYYASESNRIRRAGVWSNWLE